MCIRWIIIIARSVLQHPMRASISKTTIWFIVIYVIAMSKDYYIVPSMGHYESVVDMLGNAGYLNEVLQFIGKKSHGAKLRFGTLR